ncbi:MAG: type II secretion system protein M [Halieaceae bacterium]|jgi:type II secretory pathway component PulM|nr:type II secretion system protein M [Halieaceae bacterium]
MDGVLRWYRQFNAREQAYLLAVAVVLVLYVMFMLVLKPLAGMRDEMALRNVATEEKLSRVQAMASELKQLKASGTPQVNRNINQLINASTADVGIRPTRISPNSRGETQIRFENVGFAELVRWLYRIEYGEGIAVKEVSINQGDRGGVVKATIRLGAS